MSGKPWLGLALVLAGCWIPDTRFHASPEPDGGGSDTGREPNTVVGRVYDRCLSIDGKVAIRPTDLSRVTITALLPDPAQATGFTVINGVGNSDGTFRIEGVPDGTEYTLRRGFAYQVTTEHDLEVYENLPQRCDPALVPIVQPTTARLAVSNMTPFVRGSEGVFDQIEVVSLNIGYDGTSFTGIPDAATSLSLDYDWSRGISNVGGPLAVLDASAGDDLLILHERTEILTGASRRRHNFTHIVDLFQPAHVTLPDGAITEVTGSFQSVAGSPKSAQLFVERSRFDGAFSRTSKFSSLTVGFLTHPIENPFVTGARLASLEFSDWSRATPSLESVPVMFGDAFPATWSRTVEVEYSRSRQLALPGTTVAASIPASITQESVYAGGDQVLASRLPVAINIKVGGIDFDTGGVVKFDGMKPVTVSWNGVAEARKYTVSVSRLVASGQRTSLQFAASLSTSGTSIQIPADVFAGSEFFVLTLRESDFSGLQFLGHELPYQLTLIPGGRFRLSATCGDHAIDPGEECDDGGETATCNVDCTRAVCGDGLRNATAGEPCDTIQDTESCNVGCTLPVCGDGHLNRALEDCDDGNTTDDGNGCGSDCKLNNVCGNHHVENVVEQCDSGGIDTTTCDADCTLPECGDGHRNAAAGEECDDGNQDDNDHCNSQCKVVN